MDEKNKERIGARWLDRASEAAGWMGVKRLDCDGDPTHPLHGATGCRSRSAGLPISMFCGKGSQEVTAPAPILPTLAHNSIPVEAYATTRLFRLRKAVDFDRWALLGRAE